MGSVLIGWMVLGLIALVIAGGLWARWARSSSRDPRPLVVTTTIHGEAQRSSEAASRLCRVPYSSGTWRCSCWFWA